MSLYTINSVRLMGNLVADPKRFEAKKTRVIGAAIRIATDDSYRDDDGKWQSNPDFHEAVAYGAQANLILSCKKGDRIHIGGPLKHRIHEKNGEMRKTSYVKIKEVHFVANASRQETDQQELPEDDLPF